jgi:hypothetical protein
MPFQIPQLTPAQPLSLLYSHLQPLSIVLSLSPTHGFTEPSRSPLENFNIVSELRYPFLEADISGEILVHNPNYPAISHEQDGSGPERQYQHGQAMFDQRVEDLALTIDQVCVFRWFS